MEFSFFLTDNKSGYKTNEKWLLKNYPDLYSKIITYSSNLKINLNFKEKILFYFNNLTERPKCIICGSDIKFRNRFDKPYGEFCSLICINNNKEEMIKRVNSGVYKKYGVDFYPKHIDFIEKQKKTKKERYGDENYNNINKTKETKLKKYGNENFNNILKSKITCLNKYNTTNYSKSNAYKNKVRNNFITQYATQNIIDVNKTLVTINCNNCKKEFEITKQLLYERNKRNYDICTLCNPIGQSQRSGYEYELSDFLKTLNIEHKTSNREILKKELDIFIPSHNLAIEINGLYWHNELFVESDYHLKKTIDCQNNGIELIHIFEDEWLYKKDIVKSIIRNRLSITENNIYGRKCVIKEVSQKESKIFLDENHIQGNVNSKIRIGLYHNNVLVSLMCFSKGRILMGGKKNEWELTRFANIINTNVFGAASKLLNFFIKTYQPEKIISYSDIRLFNGNLYEKIGFMRSTQSKPNYWYVINNKKYHRFNYRKSVLIKDGYNEKYSEKQIMFERKIYRIYDCGNIRWELNCFT